MRIILLGAPGSGKGTQAAVLEEKLSVPAISTGNMLRAEMKKGSATGLKAESFINDGKLVPDAVILEMIGLRLSLPDCANGYILDGFPRNAVQAGALEDSGVVIDLVLFMDIKDGTIIERMSGRRVCRGCDATYHVTANPPPPGGMCGKCGGELFIRPDDAAETVSARLKTYHADTEPLLAYYKSRGLLRRVVCCERVEDTTANTLRALESFGAPDVP
ncbi:MAG: adenylate kinase [Oscillospiraceae bacterium]|nr:adenylate kinase [Oscillospiraceae bacterium]